MAERTCKTPDCGGVTGIPGTALGLCSKCYNRQRRHGDVTVVKKGSPGKGDAHHSWKGAAASYTALHNRVYRARGKADNCEHCGLSAAGERYEWATVHGTDGTDIHAHYISLCQACHRTYDLGKLTIEHREEITRRVAAGEPMTTIARDFRIHPSVISRGLNLRSPKWASSKR